MFSKIKAVTKKQKQSILIYEIPCRNFPKVYYIGQIKQYLHDIINQRNALSSGLNAVKHSNSDGHTFDFDNTKIL